MGYDICVLRAIVRLSRRRSPATKAALLARVPGSASDLGASLRRLERAGFVRLDPNPSLTLAGLAVGVASMPAKQAAPVLRPARAA